MLCLVLALDNRLTKDDISASPWCVWINKMPGKLLGRMCPAWTCNPDSVSLGYPTSSCGVVLEFCTWTEDLIRSLTSLSLDVTRHGSVQGPLPQTALVSVSRIAGWDQLRWKLHYYTVKYTQKWHTYMENWGLYGHSTNITFEKFK